MALQAIFYLDNNKNKFYVVQDVNYEISKSVHNFKPTSNAKGGMIYFTILSPEPEDLIFHEWVLGVTKQMSGMFDLPIVKGIKHSNRYVFFDDAFCTSLREYHSGSNGLQVYMQITICATKLWFGKNTQVFLINNEVHKATRKDMDMERPKLIFT